MSKESQDRSDTTESQHLAATTVPADRVFNPGMVLFLVATIAAAIVLGLLVT